MSDSVRCLRLRKPLYSDSPHITPVTYPTDLDKVAFSSLPATPPPVTPPAFSTAPHQKKRGANPSAKKKSHWMTNAGYALYAGVGALKTLTGFKNAIGYDNPTLIVGNLSLLASFPAVFMSHGFYAKAFMLVANHLAEMADAAVGYNEQINAAGKQAQMAGHTVPSYTTTGLNGMKEWLNFGLLGRTLTFQQTSGDKENLKAFADYVLKDLHNAGRKMTSTLHATQALAGELVKKITTPSHRINVPDAFNVKIHPDGDLRNFKALENIYHVSNTGAYGGIVGVGAEVLTHMVGIDKITNVLTRSWLMLSNLLQTAGALCSAKQIYGRTGETKKESQQFKALGIQEASGTLLEAVGSASWSNDWLLGLYRVGSALRTPYRKYKLLFERNTNGIMVPVPKEKRFWDLLNADLSFVADILGATFILGAPLVAWWERTHHQTLNPIARRKQHLQQVQKASSKHPSLKTASVHPSSHNEEFLRLKSSKSKVAG